MNLLKQETKSIEDLIIKWRRDLHKIPELHDDLPKTHEYIKECLKKLGLPIKEYSNMGISSIIEGNSISGPTIALRADMDALPIKEETGLSFASENGCMHACGHDAHVAMLLGCAKILAEHKEAFNGRVVLIFQPAEETTGGAKIMIEEGCLLEPQVDRVIAMHIGQLVPEVKNGFFGVKHGALMASVSTFNAVIHGKGGHGAKPHECVDPILISCEIIQSLQKIVSREINPVHNAVVTIGKFNAGNIVNVIPDYAEFAGTIRTHSNEDAEYIQNRIKQLIEGIAKSNRAEANVSCRSVYPATVNDDKVTDFLASSASKIVSKEKVIEISEPIMGTEDISFYLNEVPGSFAMLGSWKAHSDGICYPHHNPKFDIDESVLWIGSAIFVQCVLDYCK